MKDDWNRKKSDKELDIMIKNGYRGRKFALICITTGHMTVVSRLLPWTLENVPNWNNPEQFKNFTLFVDAYFPFTWNYTPTFELICCFQYIGVIYATFFYTGTDSFFCQVSFHFAAQYHILRLRLLNLFNNVDNRILESEFNREFGRIINVHYHINRLYFQYSTCDTKVLNE